MYGPINPPESLLPPPPKGPEQMDLPLLSLHAPVPKQKEYGEDKPPVAADNRQLTLF